MQELDARGGAKGEAEGGVGVGKGVGISVGCVAGVGKGVGIGVGRVGGAGGTARRRGEAFGDAAGGFGAADGRVGPDAVDFEEAAKGPDDRGEDVDGEGDGQQTAGDDGVALGLAFGAQHAGDEGGADFGFGAADGGGIEEDDFGEADGSVGGRVFGDAVVGVGVGLAGFV